jgi:hypothetical protein
MKTTVEIADLLLRKAKQRAARDGTTLRALMERGLNHVLRESEPPKKFKLKIKGYGSGGLTDEFKNATPDRWLEAMYGEPPGFDRD